MSRGIGAVAKRIAEDEKSVVYEYGGYNLNNPLFRNEQKVYDGVISIKKECFVEPEIHEKIKRMPSGKKKQVIKRVPVSVDYGMYLENGMIEVENCSNCWHTIPEENGVDIMILHLLFKLFLKYQETGKIPESLTYDV